MTRERKPGASARAGHDDPTGTRAGKRTLSQRLPAGGAVGATSPVQAAFAPGSAGAPPTRTGAGQEPHDDPFGLHLLGADDGGAPPGGGHGASAAPPAAGDVVQRSASAAPVAPAPRGVTRALDQARADNRDGDAIAYLDHNRGAILGALRRQIAGQAWPPGHPRLRWIAPPARVAATLVDRLVAIAHEAEGPVWWARHASAFFYPVDPWRVIDANRRLTHGAPGLFQDARPLARGPLRYDEIVGEALAVELVPRLRASLARMGPRLVALADDVRPSPPSEDQLVTSAPLDRLWARVLTDPAQVQHLPPTGAAGEAATPDGAGTFRMGLRPVAYEWMGRHDRRLWNVVRVTTPADPTAEEVAATIFGDAPSGRPLSEYAHGLVAAPPLFVLPRTWAATLPEAAAWATPEHASHQHQPLDHVLTSAAFDQAALAQGADEAAHPLARSGRAGRADTSRLAAQLRRGADQLEFVGERLATWDGLAPQVEAARSWIWRRLGALAAETPAEIARWAPVVEAQQRLLTDATGGIVEVLDAFRGAGLSPDAPAARPFRRTLAAYVAALGASHLADLGRERLAAARQARQEIAFGLLDDALDDAGAAVGDLREAEGGAFGPDSQAGALSRQRRHLQRTKLRLRTEALTGEAPDADALEGVSLGAAELTVRSRARELALKAAHLSAALRSTRDQSVLAAVAAAFDSRFETLPASLHALASDCESLALGLDGRHDEVGAIVPADPDEQATVRKRAQRQRRDGLARAQVELARIPARHGLDRLDREALDAMRTNQIAALSIDVILLILASIATAGAAAYVGGAARAAAIARLGLGARSATAIGTAANVTVDAALTAVIQTGVVGEELGAGFAENVLANAGVRAALARLAPLMGDLDDDAARLWQAGAGGKGAVVLARGTTIGAELVTAAGVSYVVHRLVRGKEPPADDQITAWFIQGASMAIGRAVATRTTQLHARLDRAGARDVWQLDHPRMLAQVKAQEALARRVETSGEADDAMRLLIENRRLLDDEAAMLRALAADPARRAALGMSHEEHARFTRENAAAAADTRRQGMELRPFRLAGVEEVVPGALWSGSSEQIATAIHQARAVGLAVRVVDVGNRSKRWRLQLGDGDRVLEIQEQTPPAVAGKAVRRPRAAGVSREARALLHAQAARELATIPVSVAETEHSSRGYLVTPADGRRMSELLADLDGAETIEFRGGILLRLDGKEWYFEFRDHAHETAAPRAGGADVASGLPDANVGTIEVYGYLGVRRIHGRPEAEWTAKERAEVAEAALDDPLIMAGHVAISFDGGRTLYGFTPKPDPSLDVGTVVAMLRAGTVFPGRVRIDSDHYHLAAQKAREGWDTHVARAVVAFDPSEQRAIRDRVLGERAATAHGQHPHGYAFPPRRPADGGDYVPYRGARATNGQDYAAECIGNCAVWPRMVGVPVPEHSGRMQDYMPELRKWENADAPIGGHRYTLDTEGTHDDGR